MSIEKINQSKFYCEDLSCEITIKDYLKRLLITLWKEKDQFSGKRPFGNGGWDYEIYKVLISNGIIKGTIDGDGYVYDCDDDEGDKVIVKCILAL